MEMVVRNNSMDGVMMANYKKERKQKAVTEKQEQAWKNQIKYLESSCEKNKTYWNEFVNFKFPTEKQYGSMVQYKSTIFNFIKYIDKDLCLTTKEDIDGFVVDAKNENTTTNKKAHIKSILTHMVQNNTADCLNRISKETLILIIQL